MESRALICPITSLLGVSPKEERSPGSHAGCSRDGCGGVEPSHGDTRHTRALQVSLPGKTGCPGLECGHRTACSRQLPGEPASESRAVSSGTTGALSGTLQWAVPRLAEAFWSLLHAWPLPLPSPVSALRLSKLPSPVPGSASRQPDSRHLPGDWALSDNFKQGDRGGWEMTPPSLAPPALTCSGGRPLKSQS